MATLKNRQVQIPGGFRFRIPELKFQTTPYGSFDVVVSEVLKAVNANPKMANLKRWPSDRTGVENWVDTTNAEICKLQGHFDYINLEGDLPKPPASTTLQRLQSVAGAVRKINSGVKLLLDWDRSGEEPVANGAAEHRASICVQCPKNSNGDLTRWFTVPASEIIRNQLGRIHDLKLSTSRDSQLGVCGVCNCVLKLKIHTPVHLLKEHVLEEVDRELPDFCWAKKQNLQ